MRSPSARLQHEDSSARVLHEVTRPKLLTRQAQRKGGQPPTRVEGGKKSKR